jgi:hypothetical protein
MEAMMPLRTIDDPGSNLELTDAEWQAVRIALADAQDHGAFDSGDGMVIGAFVGLYRLFTGHQPRRPLANPRLERLRHFVCAARRRRAIAEELVPELLDLGYSRAQLQAAAMLSA